MKKVGCFIIAVLLLMCNSYGVAAYDNTMTEKDIKYAINLNFVDSGTDGWNENVTREEFCEYAYNMVNSITEFPNLKLEKTMFYDIDNYKITSLSLAGIINGKGNGLFEPLKNITREEAAVILDRIAFYLDMNSINKDYVYKDDGEISSWAKDAVYRISANNIMSGTDKNFFNPKDLYTKEQAISSIVNLYKNMLAYESYNEKTFSDKLDENLDEGKGYIFSPISIKMVLALAANGAGGDTLKEILNTINISSLTAFNNYSEKLIDLYTKDDVINMNIANSIWLNTDYADFDFSDTYKDKVEKFYNSEANKVNRDDAVAKINAWADEHTNHKIKEIVNNSNFDSALVNATYFNGVWETQFDPEKTKKDTFTLKNGKTKEIYFMNNVLNCEYINKDGIVAVKLPYARKIGDKQTDLCISMYLMMSEDNIETERFLKDNYSDFEYTNMELSVPKFKIEYAKNLKAPLVSMGMKEAFTGKADFSYLTMYSKNNLYISDFLHKSYIDINEKETEAAAVTSVIMNTTSVDMCEKKIQIKFNKPFTFVVRDDINDEILFMGKYYCEK